MFFFLLSRQHPALIRRQTSDRILVFKYLIRALKIHSLCIFVVQCFSYPMVLGKNQHTQKQDPKLIFNFLIHYPRERLHETLKNLLDFSNQITVNTNRRKIIGLINQEEIFYLFLFFEFFFKKWHVAVVKVSYFCQKANKRSRLIH